MSKLNGAQLKAALGRVPAWTRRHGAIRRTFVFKDFAGAMKFVVIVARLAERAGHHPDIDIRWNQVALSLTTHDAGGLTAKDFQLAEQFDRQAA